MLVEVHMSAKSTIREKYSTLKMPIPALEIPAQHSRRDNPIADTLRRALVNRIAD
jgi:hypothetical protein